MQFKAKYFRYIGAGIFFIVFSVFLLWVMVKPSPFGDIKFQVTQQPYAREITVTGEGELTAKPDMALVNLAVVTQGKTVKDVTSRGNEQMNNVVKLLKGLGISEDDIKTTNYWLNPDYRYPQDGGKPQIVGYSLNQNVRVKVRDLTKVEDVLDGAVKAGVNQTGQLSFEIDDDGELRAQARSDAFKDAREKAEEMAKDAGVKLGRVVTFSESGAYPPVPVYDRAYGGALTMEAAVAPSIEPGSEQVNVTVSVTYEIE
ncbi:SIMPL domain-containing protein [Patescibacteria group bacterium]|nr:SIMPL domain-containing protein [Patescibacteria group bacterium]MBU1703638.1 SIMPL domain-containing protein [Patescibacteria group bacterium]MBU1954211.1 SIMPL domain-containing protein [Patescibacteria group bacterium]